MVQVQGSKTHVPGMRTQRVTTGPGTHSDTVSKWPLQTFSTRSVTTGSCT